MIARRFATFVVAGIVASLLVVHAGASAAPSTYAANIVDPSGKVLGTATFIGVAAGGTQVRLNVSGLPAGPHMNHIHEFGSCNPLRDKNGKVTSFGAAGKPIISLPDVVADESGHVATTYYMPNMSVSGAKGIVGLSIVIHGASGDRIACGEIGALVAP